MNQAPPGEPELLVLPDPTAVSVAAAERVAATLREAVESRGVAHFATTGGSSPVGIYAHLARPPLRDEVPWPKVHLWWGDDRFVPPDHGESNVLVAEQGLLNASALAGLSGSGGYGVDVERGAEPGAPIPAQNVHPFPTAQAIGMGKGPDWCAALYVQMLRGVVPVSGRGWPIFDLVLVGIGGDGHVLSVFGGSAAFDSTEWALGVPAPVHIGPHLPRVTLNPAILEEARVVLAVAFGAEKAEAMGWIFGPERDERRWPAQTARRAGAIWIADRAAANRLSQAASRTSAP